MKKVVLPFLLLSMAMVIYAQPNKNKINWLSIDEMQLRYAEQPKPILIAIYTNWCGWCREMDRTTYRNNLLIAYVNEHYYAVKYNAESKKTVIFNNKKFTHYAKDNVNELTLYLTAGALEYPTTVFLSTISANPAPLSGYLDAIEMEAPLNYFAVGNSSSSFIEFNKKFKSTWR